ncbi:hypothetical protein [Virgibacillus chiguensis]|uniref:Uncharacterized protein n=1 Tax=Virgibacillus chiguensis TaxID=411959 RepID=A0A1M5WGI7_9BACI|nr:hypothetical protein [Virgibacillus chiguensis]SHH86314.1 hypothetical protein SAMN05421807_11631 [Virgibacillus chiguensis]
MTTMVKYEIEKILKNKTFIGAMVVSLFGTALHELCKAIYNEDTGL